MKETIKTASVDACPLCGAADRRFMFSACEHEYTNTTSMPFSFYRCDGCRLVYMDPRPHTDELPCIYPSNYYSIVDVNAPVNELDLNSFVNRLLHRRLLKRVTGNLKSHIEITAKTKILDVGAGGGRALMSLHHEFGCEAIGIDQNPPLALLNRGRSAPVRIYKGDFLDYDFNGETFDVIYASHLIEHLPDPLSFLDKCFALLKPGGYCVIETPNVECMAAGVFGRHWGGLHVPRHWFLLSDRTARLAAEKAPNSSFQVVSVKYSPNAAFWIWSFHSLFIAAGMRRIADLLFPSDQGIVGTTLANVCRHGIFSIVDAVLVKLLGRGGNMSVVYKKNGVQ